MFYNWTVQRKKASSLAHTRLICKYCKTATNLSPRELFPVVAAASFHSVMVHVGIFLREAPNYKLHWVPINESFNFKLHICWSPLTLFYLFVTGETTLQNLFPVSKPDTCLQMGPPLILISSDELYSMGFPLDDKVLLEKHSLNGRILMKSLSHSYLIVRNSTCDFHSFVQNKVFGTCHDDSLFILSFFKYA